MGVHMWERVHVGVHMWERVHVGVYMWECVHVGVHMWECVHVGVHMWERVHGGVHMRRCGPTCLSSPRLTACVRNSFAAPGCGGSLAGPRASLSSSLEKGRAGPRAHGASDFGGWVAPRAQRGIQVLPQGLLSC